MVDTKLRSNRMLNRQDSSPMHILKHFNALLIHTSSVKSVDSNFSIGISGRCNKRLFIFSTVSHEMFAEFGCFFIGVF